MRRLSSELRGHVRLKCGLVRRSLNIASASSLPDAALVPASMPGLSSGVKLACDETERCARVSELHRGPDSTPGEAQGIKHGMEARDAMPRPDASRALHPAPRMMSGGGRAEQAV